MKTNGILKESFTLADAVNYDNAKVEVNQFMTTPNGAVLLLAFKKGQSLDRHPAPGAVLITALVGEVVFEIEGKEVVLSQGKSLMMEPGTLHSVKANQDSKVMLVKIAN